MISSHINQPALNRIRAVIERLAALVPKPRVNLTRYHGVLAPNHRWRREVTPAKRGKDVKRISNDEVRSTVEHHAARACPALSGMTWAQRLKRVFNRSAFGSILKFVVAAVGPSKSPLALRIRTSYPVKRGRLSTGSWLTYAIKSWPPLPYRY